MPSSEDASEELGALLDVLGRDIERCIEQREAQDDPFARRQFVRSAFASLEGLAYALKQIALSAHTRGAHTFTPGELSILTEQSYDLDTRGRVTERDANLRALPNLQFALSAYAASCGVIYTLPVGENEWARLQRGVRVRNRLTHPKASADLNVSDDEVADVDAAYKWYTENVVAAMLEVHDVLRAERANLLGTPQDSTAEVIDRLLNTDAGE